MNSDTIVDPFPVSSLPDRYSVSKQIVYRRMQQTNVPTIRKGRFSYVRADHVAVLDRLHQHLAGGGMMEDFEEVVDNPIDELPWSTDESPEDIRVDGFTKLAELSTRWDRDDFCDRTLEAIEMFANAVDDLAIANSDPLDCWVQLDRAIESGWVLSTSQVREVVGAKPRGEVWEYGAYRFDRVGKVGRETGWRVSKITL